MALDTTWDWQSVINIGGIWPRVLPDPDADDMDNQEEQNVMLGISADITPEATATASTNVNDVLLAYGYQFMFARAFARGQQSRGKSRGRR